MRHRQVKDAPNQARPDATEAEKSAATATKPVSDAIRRQLTHPVPSRPTNRSARCLQTATPIRVEWRNRGSAEAWVHLS
jgi:hypothetical protein